MRKQIGLVLIIVFITMSVSCKSKYKRIIGLWSIEYIEIGSQVGMSELGMKSNLLLFKEDGTCTLPSFFSDGDEASESGVWSFEKQDSFILIKSKKNKIARRYSISLFVDYDRKVGSLKLNSDSIRMSCSKLLTFDDEWE